MDNSKVGEEKPTSQALQEGGAPESSQDDEVTQSLPPSHILEDGRFIYLPPPDTVERSRFFERSIARHGLLEADMMGKKLAEDDGDDAKEEGEKTEDSTTPKVHPLAVASARLQSNGLSELNRAINLAGLVNAGEYFSLTNIVDPSLEIEAGAANAEAASRPASEDVMEQQRIKATYILKRKRTQFEKASVILGRHEKRLKAAIAAQSVVDKRLLKLRQHWRLVAPEHGTRARLHAARPTEVVAIDVDVYDRDRVGGGNQALLGKKSTLAGRLASRVPRYATIELKDDYKVNLDELDEEQQKKDEDTMDFDEDSSKPMESKDDDEAKTESTDRWTRAEPFAVADPSLGKVTENFDPNKVPMLTLQLEIQKSSTGFKQSACLSPMSTLSMAQGETTSYSADEQVLVSLQHSLFCASLFESIRSELDPTDQQQSSAGNVTSTKPQPVAWLSCESEENFLPPPSVLAGGDVGRGLAALSVVHCLEGEVKVQLDSEYTLCITLVEADAEVRESLSRNGPIVNGGGEDKSGSQSPPQLHALCRALLLHAQDVYHNHSLFLRAKAKKAQEEAAKGNEPRGLARIKKEDVIEGPRILQSCVSLGSKMLFEQRVRKSLMVRSGSMKILSARASSPPN